MILYDRQCIIYHRYDPERVPSYPVQLEERSKYCNSMLTDYYTTQSSSDQQMKSEQEMASRRSKADQRVEMADVQLTRRDSHHLLASLVPSTPSFTDGSHLIKVHKKYVFLILPRIHPTLYCVC